MSGIKNTKAALLLSLTTLFTTSGCGYDPSKARLENEDRLGVAKIDPNGEDVIRLLIKGQLINHTSHLVKGKDISVSEAAQIINQYLETATVPESDRYTIKRSAPDPQ